MGHIDSYMKYAKRMEKQITEQGNAAELFTIPDKFKAENDAINQLKSNIVKTEQLLAADKAKLNNMVKDLQTKISAEKVAAQNAQQATANQPAANQVPPTI